MEADEGKAKVVATAHELLLEVVDDSIVDAHHFQSITAKAFSSGDDTPDLEALDRAVGLYTGPFLDGDDDWILEQRERLHCDYVRALSELMHWLGEQDRYEDAHLRPSHPGLRPNAGDGATVRHAPLCVQRTAWGGDPAVRTLRAGAPGRLRRGAHAGDSRTRLVDTFRRGLRQAPGDPPGGVRQ